MPRVLISAGEPSGDRLAADLVRALVDLVPGCVVEGLAGPAMRSAGVRPLARVEDLSVMGVAEVLAQLGRVRGAWRSMCRALEEPADLLVVVDSPDFNLPLARRAVRRGVPVVFHVSPQVWAWRRGRARTIARLAREIQCLLPFEPPIYRALGGRAVFVGHPAAELDAGPPGRDWALLPGSRSAELRRQLPPMLAAARRLRERVPGARIRLGLAPGRTREDLVRAAGELGDVEVVEGVPAAVEPAGACLVASGTATLEVACMGRPMVVACRVHPLTWAIGRALVHGVRHVALPNLVAGRTVVPEHIQFLDPDRLADDWLRAATDDAQRAALAEVRRAVRRPEGAPHPAERLAALLRPGQRLRSGGRPPG